MKFSYKSNLKQVVSNLNNSLNELQSDKLLRTAALDAQAIVQTRVQQKGEGTQGSLGGYSSSYAKKRASAGRQTRIKDLTFQGDLFRSWVMEGSGKGYSVGFASKREADKAEFLEARHGPIFYLSDSEEQQIADSIQKGVQAILLGGKTILTGARGGRYYLSDSGSKVYVK